MAAAREPLGAPASRRRVSSFRPATPRRDAGAPTAALAVTIRNRQRIQAVDRRLLRAVALGLFRELPRVQSVELGVHLVAAPEMTKLNEHFLHHAGATDVITFDHSELETRNSKPGTPLHGEIFICLDEARLQAHRFRTTWQAELVRYLIHGVLHLLGHDDTRPALRRKMKRAENRLLRSLAAKFDFRQLACS